LTYHLSSYDFTNDTLHKSSFTHLVVSFNICSSRYTSACPNLINQTNLVLQSQTIVALHVAIYLHASPPPSTFYDKLIKTLNHITSHHITSHHITSHIALHNTPHTISHITPQSRTLQRHFHFRHTATKNYRGYRTYIPNVYFKGKKRKQRQITRVKNRHGVG
jgi:hypothetical protein